MTKFDRCGKEWKNLKAHLRQRIPGKSINKSTTQLTKCDRCGKEWKNLKAHLRRKTPCKPPTKLKKCERCGKEWKNLQAHLNRRIPCVPVNESKEMMFVENKYALKRYLKGWTMRTSGRGLIDPRVSLDLLSPLVKEKLMETLKDLGSFKFQIGLRVSLRKEKADKIVEYATPDFRHRQVVVQSPEDIAIPVESIMENIEKWTSKHSGWIIEEITTVWLDVAKYAPLKGGSWIDSPNFIKNKRATINVRNEDDKCFAWAVCSALHEPKMNPHRTTSYPMIDDVVEKLKDISYPTPTTQLGKAERRLGVAINLFGYENEEIIVHKISDTEAPVINLLLISKGEKQHYIWVKNLNKLLYNQTKHKEKKHFCERCLHGYSRLDLLEEHKPDCKGVGMTAVKIEMPKEGSTIKFNSFYKSLKVPYIIYADFESLIVPIHEDKLGNTIKMAEHEACGFGYVVVRMDGKTQGPPVVYRGPNATHKFLEAMVEEKEKIQKILYNPVNIVMSDQDKEAHTSSTECWICDRPLNGDSVRDHCHITGKYRGAAHNKCNLKLGINPKKTKIPVVFHNLRGYDSHLIMQSLSKMDGKISCIPNNTEKYISFSLDQLTFIDSIQFLSASLDKLVSGNKKFDITSEYSNSEYIDILTRKGVYPYEYMDSWDRFDENSLPSKDKFYSSLSESGITDSDYEHAKNVWNTFECKNLGDYHDLYLKTDVLLLADVFEQFRSTCMKTYKLDPAHYYTSPGLSWDALLRHSGVELDLLTDYDMHLFIEKGMRGGISMVSKRYAKANNPYLKDYDEEKETSYIQYLDANNLYGWAMCQSLPISDFEWVNTSVDAVLSHPADHNTGYILEVDLEYPKELHDAHDSYPLAPESLKVKTDWMSDYQLNLMNGGREVEKLVPNLMNKEKYVVHYRNLQLYTQLGLKITKVHRALKFTQDPWMKSYIELNTGLRKLATTDFEKDLYKLMNNSVFGKTMENLKKRVNVNLLRSSDEVKVKKLVAKPSFNRANVFDNDLVAIHMEKTKIMLNRPTYVGMCVLDLSKHLMYDFYYNEMKPQYGKNCNVLYTDTDSLLLEIKTKDVYEDMKSRSDLYDTSDYPKDNPLYSMDNKKVVGKMKDECNGVPISEYVGLKPKMYSILKDDGVEMKKAKGVKKYVVKGQISHRIYKDVLKTKKNTRHSMNSLRSVGHKIYSLTVNKISLSPFDSKRWISDNGVDMLAYGNYRIPSGGR